MGNCKDCKHCKDNSEYDPFKNPAAGMLLASAICYMPFMLPAFFGGYEVTKCDNENSINYGNEVEEYDTCSKFEK